MHAWPRARPSTVLNGSLRDGTVFIHQGRRSQGLIFSVFSVSVFSVSVFSVSVFSVFGFQFSVFSVFSFSLRFINTSGKLLWFLSDGCAHTYYIRIDRRAERHLPALKFVWQLGRVKSSDRVRYHINLQNTSIDHTATLGCTVIWPGSITSAQ